ncbi:MAG: HDOD domain-containing protein, partial [Halothiobacillaceae bacterium]
MSLPHDWGERLREQPLPVRGSLLERVRQIIRKDEPMVSELAGLIRRDPALSAFVMGEASLKQHKKGRDAPHTVLNALNLLGWEWLQTRMRELERLEDVIPPDDDRYGGYMTALGRALHASKQAEAWAATRNDLHYENLQIAALLHNYVELAMWRDAPRLIRAAMLRAGNTEHLTLGTTILQELEAAAIDLPALERTIAEHWYLPVQLFQDEAANPLMQQNHQQMLLLARRLVYLCERGWYHPAIREIKREIADFLSLPLESAETMIHQTALQTGRYLDDLGFYVPARLLPEMGDGIWPLPDPYKAEMMDTAAILDEFRKRLAKSRHTPTEVFRALITVLTRQVRLDRMLLLLWQPAQKRLSLRFSHGVRNLIPDNLSIAAQENRLIDSLMKKSQGLWLNAGNRGRFERFLPDPLKAQLTDDGMVLRSFVIDGKPVAVLIAWRSRGEESLDSSIHDIFTRLCLVA